MTFEEEFDAWLRQEKTKQQLRDNFQAELDPYEVFLVELPVKGCSKCSYPLCLHSQGTKRLVAYKYRITLFPDHGRRKNRPRSYHPECFELLVDWSEFRNVDRLRPLTPATVSYRDGSKSRVTNLMLDTGAEHLVWRWRELMRGWIAEQNKIELPALQDEEFKREKYVGYPKLNPEELTEASKKDHTRLGAFLEHPQDAVVWSL